jgi:hypothetical protein
LDEEPIPDSLRFLVLKAASEEAYRNKHICVTGKISDYKGVPEIVAYEPSQIKVQ